jgi:hypothetical protein
VEKRLALRPALDRKLPPAGTKRRCAREGGIEPALGLGEGGGGEHHLLRIQGKRSIRLSWQALAPGWAEGSRKGRWQKALQSLRLQGYGRLRSAGPSSRLPQVFCIGQLERWAVPAIQGTIIFEQYVQAHSVILSSLSKNLKESTHG